MTLDLSNQQYTRNWDTGSPAPLDANGFYRIQVRGTTGGAVLGFVDVDPVDKGVKNLRTGDVVQFQDGRTLPIKVRIENRAYCKDPNTDCVAKTVGAAGGDVLAERAGVRFFPGNLPGDRVVIVEEVLLKPGERCLAVAPDGDGPRTDLLEYPPCYRFRTDPGPTAFIDPPGDTPLPTAAICPDLSALPSSLAQHRQLFQEEHVAGLHDANADFLPCTLTGTIGARKGWRGLLARLFHLVGPRAAFAVDLGAGGSTDGFSLFTNGVQSTIAAASATSQTVSPGATIPVSVLVTADHPLFGDPGPLVNAPVTFTTSDGSLSPASPVVTNTDGIATVNWTVPSTTGTYTATASASSTGSPISFTATVGVVIDGVMSVGEWDGAATTDFTLNVPGGTTPATLFVKNDATNLYLAVRFRRDVVDGNNLLGFEFDNNNNGTGPEDGDDYFNVFFGADPSAIAFSDAYRSTCTEIPAGCVTTDHTDGVGAFHNDGAFSVYELSHPLNSGETGKDFALVPPTRIGLLLQMDVGSAHTRFPAGSFPTYMTISITSP